VLTGRSALDRREPTVTRTARLGGLLALPVLLVAGCGAAGQPSPAAAEHPATGSVAAARGGPPENATMVCSEEIKGKVEQVLGLPAEPATRATWADPVYTCDYALPAGPLTLTVQVFSTAERAGARLAADEAQAHGARPLPGLGQQAFGTPAGTAEVLKDDFVLTVDASRLPSELGANGQKRTDLAYEVASDVLGCWTGDE
jgi:hypothetical protein